jgi:NAD(P)-dependent dehydrogenase (short-subunit alcohol dehydrogenase family)
MDMTGKTVLITGSTDGVGRYVASELAREGAQVLIHGRDASRAKTLIDEVARGGQPSIRRICPRLQAHGSSRALSPPTTSGSTSSSAMPALDR